MWLSFHFKALLYCSFHCIDKKKFCDVEIIIIIFDHEDAGWRGFAVSEILKVMLLLDLCSLGVILYIYFCVC